MICPRCPEDTGCSACLHGKCMTQQACEWPGPEEAQTWAADIWRGIKTLAACVAIALVGFALWGL